MDLAIRFVLQLTPFANIRAMDDYADVLRYIVQYWQWDIDAYRTYLKYAVVTTPFAFIQHRPYSLNLRTDSTCIVLCALVFLAMAEWMHFVYSGLTSEELEQRMHAMGHRTFAILAAIPRLGMIIIRNMEIVMIADSPVLALWLVVASMFPALIFPLLLSGARGLRLWIANRRRPRRAPENNGAEGRMPAMTGHLGSEQAVSGQRAIDNIEVSLRHNERLGSSKKQSGFDPAADECI
ncbi:hypothetical protein EDD15DRAFT_2376995 [Pisolithus albus]|nr:hypothetical protein EDD15DRAFT_2376995 [Pisolithus albus]